MTEYKCPYCGEWVPAEKWEIHRKACPVIRAPRGATEVERAMEPISEEVVLGPIVPYSEVCELLLQHSKTQAVYALEAARRFEGKLPPPPTFPAYTKEMFERHIEDATTRMLLLLDLARRLNCPNIDKIKHNARIVFEIRKKYFGLGYTLE